eukprot:14567377-Alexandrium_andersonii.AAC.1
MGPPARIPGKPQIRKPENVCPFLVRGEQCQDPDCRAGKDHEPEAVRAAVVWRDYDRQCLEFQVVAGMP